MPGVTFFCVFVRPETNRHGGGNHPLGRTRVNARDRNMIASGYTVLFIIPIYLYFVC